MREVENKWLRGRELTGWMSFTAREAARLTSRIQKLQDAGPAISICLSDYICQHKRNLHFFVITWHLYKVWFFSPRLSGLISGIHTAFLYFFTPTSFLFYCHYLTQYLLPLCFSFGKSCIKWSCLHQNRYDLTWYYQYWDKSNDMLGC